VPAVSHNWFLSAVESRCNVCAQYLKLHTFSPRARANFHNLGGELDANGLRGKHPPCAMSAWSIPPGARLAAHSFFTNRCKIHDLVALSVSVFASPQIVWMLTSRTRSVQGVLSSRGSRTCCRVPASSGQQHSTSLLSKMCSLGRVHLRSRSQSKLSRLRAGGPSFQTRRDLKIRITSAVWQIHGAQHKQNFTGRFLVLVGARKD
jgi:hypothetical protein